MILMINIFLKRRQFQNWKNALMYIFMQGDFPYKRQAAVDVMVHNLKL
jgi:hypothetical protein